MSRAKDLITSNPRISLVGGLVEPSIDPHSRHSGRPGFSAGNTGKPENHSSIRPVFLTHKSYGTVFPESLSPPRLKLHGTRAGAHLRRRLRDGSRGSHCATGRLQQNCEVIYSLVQRMSVPGKCAGRCPPCRPARLDDPTSILPSWRSASAGSVRTCCFTNPATAPRPHALHAVQAGGFPSAGQSSHHCHLSS